MNNKELRNYELEQINHEIEIAEDMLKPKQEPKTMVISLQEYTRELHEYNKFWTKFAIQTFWAGLAIGVLLTLLFKALL